MKTVLITGASRGIGRATAIEFAKTGYKVGFTYSKSHEAAKELIKTFLDMGVMAHAACSDAADIDSTKKAVEEIERILGPIDVLVNNAGISMDALFTQTTKTMWDKVINTNIGSVYNTCQAVLPGMINRGSGVVINVSSVWGTYGASYEVAYSASKGAVATLTKALAKELGPSGIRVNAVAPGVIDTDMISNLSDEDRAALAYNTPLMRLGTPEEVASVIAFLASSGASFITGQIIGIDGGFIG